MAVPDETERDVVVRLPRDDRPAVRTRGGSDQVVSVLFGTDVESWRRGWSRFPSGAPEREAVVDASGVTRGAATGATPPTPGHRLAYTGVGRGADGEGVLDAVSRHLVGASDDAVTVLVDDIEPFVARRGASAAAEFVDGLVDRFGRRARWVGLGCSFSREASSVVPQLCDRANRVAPVDAGVADAVDRLRREDPTTFGYVRRHWAETQRGIEACERNYPQSKQVHAALADPETTPRTLGAALSGLVVLGALDTWRETVGSTRYDLTAYRPERMWAVGVALSSLADGE